MRKDIGFAEQAVAVDVSGGNQAFANGTRAIYVGGSGNLAVTMWDGGNITFSGLPAGALLPIRVSAILNSGTTATNVIGLL